MSSVFHSVMSDPRAILLMVLHVAVAGSVTVHVLLRKREIGSATGWIGLAWLSPFVGAAIYYLFGINRVRRRARELRDALPPPSGHADPDSDRDDHLAALDRAATIITGRPVLAGNKISVLHNGDDAYPLMLAAIDGAQSSVGLASYILRDDEAGGPFLAALARAQARGVAVRVLIDGIGGGYFTSRAYHRLHRDGVPAARFMHSPLPWKMPFLNLRSHKKILVVDGRQGFTGGLNIGAENVRALKKRHPVLDTHFAISGPVVCQLTEAFANDWLMQTNETLQGPAWFPALCAAGAQTARVVTAGPDQDVEKIEFVALMAITCAQRSVIVMTPYFLCDDKLVSALSLAALRGVEVDVVIPARSNHRYVDFAMQANVGPLLKAGCRIWKNDPPFDHSKLMVVDGAWSLIGSSNWDMRSFRLNFELNLEVYSSDLAAGLEALMRGKFCARLTEDELAARSLPARLRDAGLRLLLPYL